MGSPSFARVATAPPRLTREREISLSSIGTFSPFAPGPQEESLVCWTPRGDVAQLVERGLCKPEVVGSIPIVSTSRDSDKGSSTVRTNIWTKTHAVGRGSARTISQWPALGQTATAQGSRVITRTSTSAHASSLSSHRINQSPSW